MNRTKSPSEMDVLDTVPGEFDVQSHIMPEKYRPEEHERVRPDEAHEVVADLLIKGEPELAAVTLMAYTEKMASKNYQGTVGIDWDQFGGDA